MDIEAHLSLIPSAFGPDSRNRFEETRDPGPLGAEAALETFYRALNLGDLDLVTEVWHDDELVQLDNPVGGILRSRAQVRELYSRLFSSGIALRVTFEDVLQIASPKCMAFAGRENGTYRDGAAEVPLNIRTTRVVSWSDVSHRWAQSHHHGSIDDAEALAEYQRVVRSR